jgi:peptidyl-prolyl cis-trans isomerase C
MKFFRCSLFLVPPVCLLAQTPPAAPAGPVFTPQGQAQALASPSVPADKVVLSVGDAKLTAGQFEQIIDSLPEQYRSVARGPGRKDFGQNLVRVLLLSEEGKRRKLNETPEYKTQSEFQAANLLAGKTFAQIGENLKVDDAEVHKYYDAHKTDYEQVRARHILIRAAGSPAPADPGKKELTDEEALAKAQALRKKLVDGADFANLAAAESDDSGSKASGGDLNFFKRGQMVPQFEEAAFAMKVGEISEPVKSPFGYHVIQVQAKKSFDEAKPEVERKMKADLAQKALEDMEKKTSVMLDPAFFGPAGPPPASPTPVTK